MDLKDLLAKQGFDLDMVMVLRHRPISPRVPAFSFEAFSVAARNLQKVSLAFFQYVSDREKANRFSRCGFSVATPR
jgi:hypothetical protein